MRKTNYLSELEARNIEKVAASYVEGFQKLGTSPSEAELIKAAIFVMTDYINDRPDILDLSSLLCNQGTVNADGKVVANVGYHGEAVLHAIGSEATFVQTYTKDVSCTMQRISWLTGLDINAVKNQNLVKLLEDAAVIRYHLGLRKFKYLWDLVVASLASGDPIFATASSVTKTTLDTLMNTMMDVAGGVKAIVGRWSLVTAIQGFSGFSDFTLRELETQNMIGQYRGAKIIGLSDAPTVILDSADNEFSTANITANALILVGEKGIFEGQNPVKSIYGLDVPKAQELQHTFLDYGAMVVDKRRIGIYEIA